MNNLFSSNLWPNHSFQDYFTRVFSNQATLLRDKKILALAACTLTLLSLLVYGIYRWRDNRTVVEQQPEDTVNSIQEVAQKQLLIDLNDHKEEEIKRPLPAQAALIPPAPDIDFRALCRKLASETAQVPSFPFSDRNCRFQDILCPEETRVNVPGSTDSHYLHANHVRLEGVHFILTQYPLPTHVPLFWRACEKVCLILDLTNDKDMQKGLLPYAPSLVLKEGIKYGEMTITCKSQKALSGIKACLYAYFVEGDPSKLNAFEIQRLHYEGWDDFQGANEDDFDFILALMEQAQAEADDPDDPFAIHCRAGVGRSGTIAVAYAIKLLIKQNKVDASNLMDQICRLILEGRRQRGIGFVQTPEQLQAIWKWSWRALHRAPSPVSLVV